MAKPSMRLDLHVQQHAPHARSTACSSGLRSVDREMSHIVGCAQTSPSRHGRMFKEAMQERKKDGRWFCCAALGARSGTRPDRCRSSPPVARARAYRSFNTVEALIDFRGDRFRGLGWTSLVRHPIHERRSQKITRSLWSGSSEFASTAKNLRTRRVAFRHQLWLHISAERHAGVSSVISMARESRNARTVTTVMQTSISGASE